MLQVAVDESEDPTVFMMGAYLADPAQWQNFSAEWNHALQTYTHGRPFKMSEAVNELSAERLRECVGYLYDVIQQHARFALAVAVEPEILDRVMGDLADQRHRNRYFFCFYRVIVEVMNRPELGEEEIEFIFDAGRETGPLLSAWDEFKAAAPADLRRRIAGPVKFRSDDKWPPLQAADLKAWWARKRFKELYQGAAPTPNLRNTRPNIPPVPAISCYCNERMLLAIKVAAQGQLFVTTDPPGFEVHSGGVVSRIRFE